MTPDDDQTLVAALLASTPPPDVPPDFVSRVNARIDESAGWFGLADFRVWTLRLAPAVGVLAVLTVIWPGAPAAGISSTSATVPSSAVPATTFSPASAADWQQEVSADVLLDAALQSPRGGDGGR
jgi:hypothetical protein